MDNRSYVCVLFGVFTQCLFGCYQMVEPESEIFGIDDSEGEYLGDNENVYDFSRSDEADDPWLSGGRLFGGTIRDGDADVPCRHEGKPFFLKYKPTSEFDCYYGTTYDEAPCTEAYYAVQHLEGMLDIDYGTLEIQLTGRLVFDRWPDSTGKLYLQLRYDTPFQTESFGENIKTVHIDNGDQEQFDLFIWEGAFQPDNSTDVQLERCECRIEENGF